MHFRGYPRYPKLHPIVGLTNLGQGDVEIVDQEAGLMNEKDRHQPQQWPGPVTFMKES